ncbi:MAG: hypothetical protein RPS47_13860 [Colwellia sp.]|jgi:hypothetical protein
MSTVQIRSRKSLKSIILDEFSFLDDKDVLFLRNILFKVDTEIDKYTFIELKSNLFDLYKKISMELEQLRFENNSLDICEDKIKSLIKKIEHILKNLDSMFTIKVLVETDDLSDVFES